jgi:hypothetical protein
VADPAHSRRALRTNFDIPVAVVVHGRPSRTAAEALIAAGSGGRHAPSLPVAVIPRRAAAGPPSDHDGLDRQSGGRVLSLSWKPPAKRQATAKWHVHRQTPDHASAPRLPVLIVAIALWLAPLDRP